MNYLVIKSLRMPRAGLALCVTAVAVCTPAFGAARPEAPAAGQDTDGCLAGGCHQKVAAHIAEARVSHAPLQGQRPCTPCHQPHGKAPPKRRSAAEIEALCGVCHAGTAKKLRESRHRHSALDRHGCTACHLPHGGQFMKLLKNVVYVSDPVSGPRVDTAALCWSCHDRRLAYEKQADGLTRFRDGDRNLHEHHVTYKKGRSCKACHDTHASDQPFHMRPDLPFGTGGWRLPIRYTRTEDGGLCEVGCHRLQSYRRAKTSEAR